MSRPPRHIVSAVGTILLAGSIVALVARSDNGPLRAGFWFEPITYSSRLLGGPLAAEDLSLIERTARAELTRAYESFPVAFTTAQDSRYTVRVAPTVNVTSRLGRVMAVSGSSHAVTGFGGRGTVNFEMQAANAIVYAPSSAPRSAIIEAIGHGIGRAAVHEFAHVFLPSTDFHDAGDRMTYEYSSASRREQYYGELRWGRALPLLERRFAR